MECLNYHHLRYFWTVATEGSLARAAEKLHVFQPSISEQICELESVLDEKLFRREGPNNNIGDRDRANRLDLVLSDEPASGSTSFKMFTHALGESGATFCAEKKLAARLKRSFPTSLHGAPALLPAENTVLRHALETWFCEHGIQPRVVVEFEDLALMKVMAAEGRGFIAVPTVALDEAVKRYGFQMIGHAKGCRMRFHAITAERRIAHPAVALITNQAQAMLKR